MTRAKPGPRGASGAKRGRAGLRAAGHAFADRVRFDPRGLVPVVAQDEAGGVLMLAWANREALVATFVTGRGTYWSRSRGQLWVKGDTSGHVQQALAVSLDCDGDAVLYIVRQTGPACHLGTRSCFAQREEIATWPTNASSPSSGPRSSPARRTTGRRRATPASSSRTRPRSGRR